MHYIYGCSIILIWYILNFKYGFKTVEFLENTFYFRLALMQSKKAMRRLVIWADMARVLRLPMISVGVYEIWINLMKFSMYEFWKGFFS